MTDNGFLKFNRNDGSVFQLPYDKAAINEAAEGEYKEKATGNIIINPDYITTWTIHVKRTDSLDEIKQNGFMPKIGLSKILRRLALWLFRFLELQ